MKDQKIINGKLVYKIDFLGNKIPVLSTEEIGDIIVEETPGSITVTTRGTLLNMNQDLRGHWETQHKRAQKCKRQSNKQQTTEVTRSAVAIRDALNPTVRPTRNSGFNYMNPDEYFLMDSMFENYGGYYKINRKRDTM